MQFRCLSGPSAKFHHSGSKDYAFPGIAESFCQCKYGSLYNKWLPLNAYQNNVKQTPPSSVLVPSSSESTLVSTEQTTAPFSTHQVTHTPPQMPVTRTLNESGGHHFNNCTVNTQNYFGSQSTNEASSSTAECQIGEFATSPDIPRRILWFCKKKIYRNFSNNSNILFFFKLSMYNITTYTQGPYLFS